MVSLSHGRNTMKTDSQNYKGRSSMLYANRIACIRTPNVDEDGAIVLGHMTEPSNHDGQDGLNKAIPFHRPNQGRITL
jgi:hypothetical protein